MLMAEHGAQLRALLEQSATYRNGKKHVPHMHALALLLYLELSPEEEQEMFKHLRYLKSEGSEYRNDIEQVKVENDQYYTAPVLYLDALAIKDIVGDGVEITNDIVDAVAAKLGEADGLQNEFTEQLAQCLRENFPELTDEDEGIQECPICHESCHNDQTIDDHGMCIDCFHDRDTSEVRHCANCGSDRVIDGLKPDTVYCLNCGFQTTPLEGEDE